MNIRKMESNAEQHALPAAAKDGASKPTRRGTSSKSGKSGTKSKQVQLVALLSKPNGVRVSVISERLGWQAHTVRAAISGRASVPTRSVDQVLICNIAKAHQYFHAYKQGQTFARIATNENLSKRRIHQLIDLAFLAPDIVKSILQGDQPTGLTAQWLAKNPLPADWQAQRRIVATR